MGMYTLVGEGVSTLSGGQRQRVLIARALAGQPRSCCWTKRRARSTTCRRRRCWKPGETARRPAWSLRTVSRRCAMPTGSWCWTGADRPGGDVPRTGRPARPLRGDARAAGGAEAAARKGLVLLRALLAWATCVCSRLAVTATLSSFTTCCGCSRLAVTVIFPSFTTCWPPATLSRCSRRVRLRAVRRFSFPWSTWGLLKIFLPGRRLRAEVEDSTGCNGSHRSRRGYAPPVCDSGMIRCRILRTCGVGTPSRCPRTVDTNPDPLFGARARTASANALAATTVQPTCFNFAGRGEEVHGDGAGKRQAGRHGDHPPIRDQ